MEPISLIVIGGAIAGWTWLSHESKADVAARLLREEQTRERDAAEAAIAEAKAVIASEQIQIKLAVEQAEIRNRVYAAELAAEEAALVLAGKQRIRRARKAAWQRKDNQRKREAAKLAAAMADPEIQRVIKRTMDTLDIHSMAYGRLPRKVNYRD